MPGSQGSQCTSRLRKPWSQQNSIFKWYYFGRTEGKKRQKHKVSLLSLMHKDKAFASWKRLLFLVCTHCQGFDVYHKSRFNLLILDLVRPHLSIQCWNSSDPWPLHVIGFSGGRSGLSHWWVTLIYHEWSENRKVYKLYINSEGCLRLYKYNRLLQSVCVHQTQSLSLKIEALPCFVLWAHLHFPKAQEIS